MLVWRVVAAGVLLDALVQPACGAALSQQHAEGSSHGASESATNVVTVRAADFELHIALSTCEAVASYHTHTGGRHPGVRAGRAVPLLSLYNRVADNLATNLSPCESVEVLEHGDALRLRVQAAHRYGFVEVLLQPSAHALSFTVANLNDWRADPVERHLEFGEFWSGILDSNATAPIMMGRLQGPRGLPGTGEISAGFMTVSPRSYFRYIFYAQAGDAVAFGFAGPTSAEVAALWTAVAHEHDIAVLSATNRFNTYLWTDLTEASAPAAALRAQALGVETLMLLQDWHLPGRELTVNSSAFPRGLNHTVELLRSKFGLKVGLHLHPDIVWPCSGGVHSGLECFTNGYGVSQVLLEHPEALMQEGLAPTFRSGQPHAPHPPWTEDLGFWWGHDQKDNVAPATVAKNGNPKPCGQGSCNPRDWGSNSWAPDMHLTDCHWSTAGFYRGGSAIGFDGSQSRGVIAADAEFDQLRDGLTIGLVVHPSYNVLEPHKDVIPADSVLWTKPGVFELSMNGSGVLFWSVYTTPRDSGEHEQRQYVASSTGILPSAESPEGFALKCTYNATSGMAQIFLSGKVLPAADQPQLAPPGSTISRAGGSPMYIGASLSNTATNAATNWSRHFRGALEELYIKNVTTESRSAYVFADDCRSAGTFLIDLTTEDGRRLFVNKTVGVLSLANFSDVQFDGFEKLQLISRVDFGHSNKTFSSGVFNGHITPGHYHLPWPLRVGQGILQAIEETHARLQPSLAIELSFMASGLGPWRPDMNTYVDEKVVRHNSSSAGPDGYVLLGLQWHAKLVQRTELTGMAINAYNMEVDVQDPGKRESDRLIHSRFELDYFLGGLITTGVGPQPISKSHVVGKYDAVVRGWMNRYARYGHLREEKIQTLYYDTKCCHIQGVCQWVPCADVVAVGLQGGEIASNSSAVVVGVYAGGPAPVAIPQVPFFETASNGTMLLFVAHGVNATTLAVNSTALRELHVVPLSPVESDASVTLHGSFFALQDETVRLTVKSETGTIVSSHLLWRDAQTGPREWSARLGQWSAVERPTLVFNKIR